GISADHGRDLSVDPLETCLLAPLPISPGVCADALAHWGQRGFLHGNPPRPVLRWLLLADHAPDLCRRDHEPVLASRPVIVRFGGKAVSRRPLDRPRRRGDADRMGRGNLAGNLIMLPAQACYRRAS